MDASLYSSESVAAFNASAWGRAMLALDAAKVRHAELVQAFPGARDYYDRELTEKRGAWSAILARLLDEGADVHLVPVCGAPAAAIAAHRAKLEGEERARARQAAELATAAREAEAKIAEAKHKRRLRAEAGKVKRDRQAARDRAVAALYSLMQHGTICGYPDAPPLAMMLEAIEGEGFTLAEGDAEAEAEQMMDAPRDSQAGRVRWRFTLDDAPDLYLHATVYRLPSGNFETIAYTN